MFLNNSVSHRQAQARSLTLSFLRGSFRGEERIIDALDMFLRDACPSVSDNHAYCITIHRRNLQCASVGHRIFCVEEEVQEHLLQTSGVPLNCR